MISRFLSVILRLIPIELPRNLSLTHLSCPWSGAPVHGLMELSIVLLQIEGEFLQVPMAHALNLLGP